MRKVAINGTAAWDKKGSWVMVGSTIKRAAAAVAVLMLAGCGGPPDDGLGDYGPQPTAGRQQGTAEAGSPLQCVPYAREQSGVRIFGDAYTWWDKADGTYERSYAPQEGAVMVLYNYAGPRHGHVAVVRRIVSSREIRIDHANWLNDGNIYENNPVRDVSPGNDWSQVQVYNIPAGTWGHNVYPVQGFILSGAPGRQGGEALVAQIQAMLDEDEAGAGN